MKLYRYPTKLTNAVSEYNGCILSFGNFDGLHIGHQKLIAKINERAKSLNLVSVLLNFYPHPLTIINGRNIKVINSFREKNVLVEKLGVDYLYMFRFNQQIRNLNADKFLDLIIEKLNPHEVYVGEDASIGVNREGDVNFMSSYLKSKNIFFQAISFISSQDCKKISSSEIRNEITKGQFKLLNDVLNRKYSIIGKVIKGKQIARKLDFKTANINCKNRLVPKLGVYVTKTIIDGKVYSSISNLGIKPTYGSDYTLLETHIFDNQFKDFYGKTIEVVFIKYIREEVKFSEPPELKKQIIKDCKVARVIHNEQN